MPPAKEKAPRRRPGQEITLHRAIGFWEAVIYGVGLILGAGIYALIGEAAGLAGNMVWFSFALAAIIASFTGLSYAELSSMFPKEAAEFIYVRRAFGSEFLAFMLGWLFTIANITAAALVALAFGGYFVNLFCPGWAGQNFFDFGSYSVITPAVIFAIILIVCLSFLNYHSIKESSKMNVIFTFIETGGLVLIVLFGLGYLGSVDYMEMNPDLGLVGVGGAVVLIFFAFLGFEDIANIAEETKDPTRNIPKAIVVAIVISTVLYILVALVSVSVLPWNILGSSDAPLADVAGAATGAEAGTLLAFIALFATANTVLIILIVGSRMIYGMAREGSLPKSLGKVHRINRTPWVAILFMMVFAALFTFFGEIEFIASVTNLYIFTAFLMVNLSLIKLRFSRPELKRPFKVPLSIGRLPVIATLGVLSCFGALVYFALYGHHVLTLNAALLALGVGVYWVLRKRKQKYFKRRIA
jgi:APA family basic amino acid/polyamine antiporter